MPDSIPSAPAGRRRFWITVLFFAIANVAAWVGYHQYLISRLHLLRVVKYEPGREALVSARPTLTWEFNLDVSHVGSASPGTIVPPVAGKWLWHDGRLLTFTPDADLPRATKFVVNLPAERIRTSEGIRLDKTFTDTFTTAPLKLLSIRQSAFDDESRLVVELEFDDAVIPTDVASHLTLKDPEWHFLKFHPHGDAAGKIVRFQTDPLPELRSRDEAFVFVMLAPGLAGTSGPLGIGQDWSQKLPVATDLMATEVTASSPGNGDPSIAIRFNNSAVLDNLREVISVDPPVKFDLRGSADGYELTGAFQPGSRYAVKIAKAPTGSDAHKFPRPDVLSAFVPDKSPEVWFEHHEGYLGSQGNRTLLAHAVNLSRLNITITRMYDSNLVIWRTANASASWNDPSAYTTPIATKTIKLADRKNQQQDIRLSLDELLPPQAPRDGVYRIGISTADSSIAAAGYRARNRYRRFPVDDDDGQPIYEDATALVALSDIGLTARRARDGVHVWAVSLATAKPLANVRIRAYSNKNQPLGEARSDKDGLTTLSDLNPAAGEYAAVLLADIPETGARLAGDAQPAAAVDAGHQPERGLTWLDLAASQLNFTNFDAAGKPYLRSGFEAFIYTDRGVYRPGETAHLRAIVRGPDLVLPKSFPVRWQFHRPDGRDWKEQVTKIDADGAASLDIQLPDDLPTGLWSADIALPGESGKVGQSFGSVSFQVEEFIPNRMKVKLNARAESPAKNTDRLSIANAGIIVEAQADYLFGRPVAERPASLTVRVDPANFTPSQWPGWTFHDAAKAADVLGGARAHGGRTELAERELNDHGHATWNINVGELLNGQVMGKPIPPTLAENPGPWKVTFFTSVTEAGGRAVSATRTVDVDRRTYYVGLKPTKPTVAPGTPLDFEIICVAPDGTVPMAETELKVTLFRDTWNNTYVYQGGRYRYNSQRKLEPFGESQTTKIFAGRGSCRVTPPGSGSFVLLARDTRTGCMTSYGFESRSGAWEDNVNRERPEELQVSLAPPPPNWIETATQFGENLGTPMLLRLWHGHAALAAREIKFRPGDAARVIVRSPFAGRLLLSIESDSVLSTQVIDMPASQMSIPIKLPDNCRPTAYVTASVVRAIDPNASWRTHRAFGLAIVPVDNSDRKLTVNLTGLLQVRPSNTLQLAVKVTHSDGSPAADAAVTLATVDEGILSLTDFVTPDPFAFFTARRAHAVRWSDIYSLLMPEVARAQGASPVGGDTDAAPASRHSTPVTARRVRSVALVSGILHTDAEGIARADFQVPEFAGRLRAMAVTYQDHSFGSSETAVVVRPNLLVQSSWPRFAAPTDQFTVPLVVFNNSGIPGKAQIRVTVDGPLGFASNRDSQLMLETGLISPGGQATVSLDVVAAARVGVVKVNLTASMNEETFTENIELPIRPASPTISVGGYAIATTTQPAKLQLQDGLTEGTKELQIRAAAFPTFDLPRGIEYLDRYPYGCAEQTTSACFPLVALSDLGPSIAPGVFTPERIESKLQSGITRLIGMQTSDGGISMWAGANQTSWPWVSVYAAHFVVEAEAAGHKVPEEFRDHLLAYVRTLLNEATDKTDTVEVQAYACYVLALSGRPERPIMSRLTEIVNTDKPPKFGYRPIAAESRFHLAAAWLAAGRRDLASGMIPKVLPKPQSQRQLSGNIGSAVRDRAVLVSTLLAIDPDHPAIPAIVQQIADAARPNGWRSTQDAAFAVIALGKYTRQLKNTVPFETASLVDNTGNSIAESTNGRPLAIDPKSFSAGALELRITGMPNAKSYVSWLQTGVPLKPPADEDAGMKIRRRYLDAAGDPLAGEIRSGDLVQIELTIETTTPLEHIVIDDLLPAGLEIENARLQTSADGRQVDRRRRQIGSDFAHGRLDVRDDRLVVVGSMPQEGRASFTYLARAVTPGTFVIPPVRGECMYDIGTHSINGAGGMLKIVGVKVGAVAKAN